MRSVAVRVEAVQSPHARAETRHLFSRVELPADRCECKTFRRQPKAIISTINDHTRTRAREAQPL
jgi:hypothetical protein